MSDLPGRWHCLYCIESQIVELTLSYNCKWVLLCIKSWQSWHQKLRLTPLPRELTAPMWVTRLGSTAQASSFWGGFSSLCQGSGSDKLYLLFEKLHKGKVLCKSRSAPCRVEESQHLRFSKLLSRLKFWPEAYIVTMIPGSIMMMVQPWAWKQLGRGLQGCSNGGRVPVISASASASASATS